MKILLAIAMLLACSCSYKCIDGKVFEKTSNDYWVESAHHSGQECKNVADSKPGK